MIGACGPYNLGGSGTTDEYAVGKGMQMNERLRCCIERWVDKDEQVRICFLFTREMGRSDPSCGAAFGQESPMDDRDLFYCRNSGHRRRNHGEAKIVNFMA
jgi:hypothetical protein